MAPRFLDRLRKGDAGDARDQQEPAVTAIAPKKTHWWQHARGEKQAPAERRRGDEELPIGSSSFAAAPGGAGAPGPPRFVAEGHSSSSSLPAEQEPAREQQQAAGARSGSQTAIDDDVATAATVTANLGLGNPARPSPPQTSPQQRRSSADDRSRRSEGGSSGSRDAKPSLDSVLPSTSGGTEGGGGSGSGGGSSSTPPASSGRSSAAAVRAPAPSSQQQHHQPPPPPPPAPLSKPPLPPTAAEKILASSSKQPRALSSFAQQQQQQQHGSSSSSSSTAAATAVALGAALEGVAPAGPKLTGMAAFDVADDRYSFDVADGSAAAALGSPARPGGWAGEGIDEGDDEDAADTSASAPRPAPPPPPAPFRSSLDAPVSQRQSMESAGSAGRGGNAGGGGGYTSGGGASVASSTARSARSSFALEAADRPAAASRGASPPPSAPSLPPSSAAATMGSGGPGGSGEELYAPQAGPFDGGGGASSSFSSPAATAAAAAVEWLPPLETSAAFLPSLPSSLISMASSLALVPPDTPLPASLLWRLWGLQKKKKKTENREKGAERGEKADEEQGAGDESLAAAATAIADELAAPEADAVMKVARLADGSAWALTSPAVHAALVQARLGGPAGEHRELLVAYCLGGGGGGGEGERDGDGGRKEDPRSLLASLLPASDPAPAARAAALLASSPDDGYLMHNVGHHLAAAGALPALAALLGDAGWLDAKLRSYGAAAVTADFRRALALAQQAEQRAKEEEENVASAAAAAAAAAAVSPSSSAPPPTRPAVSTSERIRLLLAAFQMSAPAAVACPAARGVLEAQMASRLLAAERALLPCPRASSREGAPWPAAAPKLLLQPPPPAAAAVGDVAADGEAEAEAEAEAQGPAVFAPARGLRTATPSLQQAGGAARLVLRGHTSPVLRVLIAPNGVDVVAVAADGAVRVFDLEVGDCVLHVPAIALAPPSSSSPSSSPGRLLGAGAGAGGKAAAAAAATRASYSNLSAFPLPSAAAAAAAKAASPAAFAVSPAAAAATNPRLRDGNAVEDAALDGSGRLLLTACADGVGRVWDLAAASAATAAAAGAVSPSPSACLVRELDGGPRAAPLHAAALCASGRTAATAGSDGLLRLWDVEAGACVAALSAHSGAGIRALALAPDGGVALTGGEDFGAVAWDVRRLRPLAVFAGHSGWVVAVALVPSPSSSGGGSSSGSIRRALTASHDGTARVWQLRSGACAHVLEGHGGRLSAVRASACGSTALTASDDGTTRLWDLDSGACLRVMDPGRSASGGGSMPDGGGWIADAILGGGGGGGGGGSGNPGAAAAPPPASDDDAEGEKRPCPPRHLPSSIVAAACGDGHVAAFDASSGKLLALLPGHAGPALCVAATRRGRFVVTGGADGTARVWDLAAPSSAGLLARKHEGRVCCIAVSEAAAGAGAGAGAESSSSPLPVVVTVGDDGAFAWSPSGAPLPPLRGGSTPTRWARASPDGSAVAVASPDGGIRAWRAAVAAADSQHPESDSRNNLPTLEPGVAGGPGSRVRAFDAAPAARVALLATYDSAVKVVRYGSEEEGRPPSSSSFFLQSRGGGPGSGPASAPGERGHPGVGHARLSADGLVAATASVDGSARLWCARTGRCLAKLVATGSSSPSSSSASPSPPPSLAPVVATSLSLDGRTLLVVAADGAANAWDLSSAVESAKGGDGTCSLSSSSDATPAPRVLAAAGSGTVGGRLSPDGARALLWCGSGGGGSASSSGSASPAATVWLLRDGSSLPLFRSSTPPFSPRLVAHLESPTGGVSATAWSRDGSLAALGSADGTLRVVCTGTGRTKGFFMADAGVTAVAFCARAAVVGCDDGSVHFVALE